MSSLREQQRRFAEAVRSRSAPGAAADRMSIYRHSIRRNYRNALASTYPVVMQLVGAAFFEAAVDGYVNEHPSICGDLNSYGDRFDAFLARYAPAEPLPYLPDIARLEWAIDDVHRAADSTTSPDGVLAALAAVPPDKLTALRLRIAPTCRLVSSRFPILRIWRTNQLDHSGDRRVSLDEGGDHVLVRRDAGGIPLERIDVGDCAFLSSLASGATLADAIEQAVLADQGFDLAASLRAHVASSTIAGIDERALSGSRGARDQ